MSTHAQPNILAQEMELTLAVAYSFKQDCLLLVVNGYEQVKQRSNPCGLMTMFENVLKCTCLFPKACPIIMFLFWIIIDFPYSTEESIRSNALSFSVNRVYGK